MGFGYKVEDTLILKKVGLVVGCGSVGKRHALALASRSSFIIIVDPEESIRNWVEENIKIEFAVYLTLNEVPFQDLLSSHDVTAVIATWGPSHSEIFEFLVQNGIKKVVCEKPFTNSIESAARMVSQAEANSVQVVVGITRRYTGFAELISDLLNVYCGGKAEIISVVGGAQCISTIGIHWLDLAFQLFDSKPTSVIARLSDGSINPRNNTLGYWEGSAIWDFPEHKSFTISLTNSSRVSSRIEILGKLGGIEIESSGDITISVLELTESEIDQPITRTKQSIIKAVLDSKNLNNGIDPFVLQLETADGLMLNPYPLDEAVEVLGALIGAFESSAGGTKVDLPISAGTAAYSRIWNIS
jgi:predicted dehydrogenase